MKKFEIFKNEKIVINVRSQKQYDDFMKMCEEQELRWSTGYLATTKNFYNNYKENTCIDLNNLKCLYYCDIDSYKNDGYKIITYKDFIKEESKQFTKSDLKDNHIVVQGEGSKSVWINLNHNCFNEDLRDSYWDNDIIEVYEYDKLVWKRKEKPVEILDEVEKKYLSDVIRPKEIKTQVEHIRKRENQLQGWQDIVIQFKKNKGTLYFPEFNSNTMYKNMEVNKEYTLKELGLE